MLAETVFPVLRLRLAPSVQSLRVSIQRFPLVRNIIGRFCHVLCGYGGLFFLLGAFFLPRAAPRINMDPPPPAPPLTTYNKDVGALAPARPPPRIQGRAPI